MSSCMFGHDWDRKERRCRTCGQTFAQAMGGVTVRQQDINYVMDPLRFVERKPRVPPFVTVADCGHCFEDVGNG